MGINMVDKQCADTEYWTPKRVLEAVWEYAPISLDPATHPSNPTMASLICTKKENGLRPDWACGAGKSGLIFVNPPYGRELRAWVEKIHEEAEKGAHIMALLPGQRFEQEYYQRCLFTHHLTAFCMIRRRLQFQGPAGAGKRSNPYGSFMFLFNGNGMRFGGVFGGLGRVVTPGLIW